MESELDFSSLIHNILFCPRSAELFSYDSTLLVGNTQEKADTKIILHAVNLAGRGAKTLHIFSPDTDVMVLAIRRFPLLPSDSGLFLGLSRHYLSLKQIYEALGPLKASALRGLHFLSGVDVTGLSGNGKITWWKAFDSTSKDVL